MNPIDRRSFLERSGAGALGLLATAALPPLAGCGGPNTVGELRAATFAVDATPPVESNLAYNVAERIVDPLSARGVLFLLPEGPVVLISVDWIAISNGGQDAWRMAIADAARTSPDRVAVHVGHQHDAPGCDFDLEQMLMAQGRDVERFDPPFARATIRRAAQTVTQARNRTVPVTHVGTGTAEVEQFASTRRLWGGDGQVKYVRYTSTEGRPDLRELPEGLVDPWVRVVSLWNEDEPLAAMTYYACHPQSYYREGGVSCDTVGIARRMREEATGIFHVHFDGAGGNVGAGKYNDGSREMRSVLARRLADGIAAAWKRTERRPIRSEDVTWRTRPVILPVRILRSEDPIPPDRVRRTFLEDPTSRHARDLIFQHRMDAGRSIILSVLELGNVRLLQFPGELFVEYQLAAQRMRPDLFVAMAAYGDDGPGYIGTRTAYPRGGYEVGPVARAGPGSEEVLTEALRELLNVPADTAITTPSEITRSKQRLP